MANPRNQERTPDTEPLRSDRWFDSDGLAGWAFRSFLSASGFSETSFRRRPVIGLLNTWSELTNCNVHLRELADYVKRGVLQAGGFPVELPLMSLAEVLMVPTTMLYRNLLAMEVEESLRAYPLDGAVLLTGCDKTTPACLLGAASADLPAIVLTGGPMLNGRWRGRDVGACTDCMLMYDAVRAGQMSKAEHRLSEGSVTPSAGHCQTMGTASTMACVTEALGMALPGTASIPAPFARRRAVAEEAGFMSVELVRRGIRPSDILTLDAFENAIRVLHAIGGSTNGVIHLLALAGRVGIDLDLDRFDELSQTTPWLVNLKPSGRYLMEEFHDAGGVPAVMAELADRLHLDARTVSGETVLDNIDGASSSDSDVIASAHSPLAADGALVVLRGNLCPDGAILKRTAADPALLAHEGTAVVLEANELYERINDPDLPVTADSVLIMRGAGPIGYPGMPEMGQIPIPERLLRAGVTDMVRISDARISGTSYGTLVVHAAPEAATGGPLALVENGDRVRLDVERRRLDVLVSEETLDARRKALPPRPPSEDRGWVRLYRQHVLQANEGCDLDCLRGRTPAESTTPWLP